MLSVRISFPLLDGVVTANNNNNNRDQQFESHRITQKVTLNIFRLIGYLSWENDADRKSPR